MIESGSLLCGSCDPLLEGDRHSDVETSSAHDHVSAIALGSEAGDCPVVPSAASSIRGSTGSLSEICDSSSLRSLSVDSDDGLDSSSRKMIYLFIGLFAVIMVLWIIYFVVSLLFNLGTISGDAIKCGLVVSSAVLPIITVASAFALSFYCLNCCFKFAHSRREVLVPEVDVLRAKNMEISRLESGFSRLIEEQAECYRLGSEQLSRIGSLTERNRHLEEENRRLRFLLLKNGDSSPEGD